MKRFLVHCWLAVCLILAGPLAALAATATVTVSAAASLAQAFGEIKQAFEHAHPGVTVLTNFGASGTLLAQIEAGAPVDLFASADQESMDRAQAKGLLETGTRVDFAANELVLARSAALPPLAAPQAAPQNAGWTAWLSLPALSGGGRLAMGQPATTPAGRYALEALKSAGVWDAVEPRLVYGESVRQVLDYVVRGEVEAGFVFATDVRMAGGKALTLAVVPASKPVRYPLAVLAASQAKPEAKALAAFLSGPPGQAILEKYGFQKP